ncbi:MAG: hypothetical protein LBT16_04860 [Treponema sp.]|nr:hypothetical protein [Treponema sp.]
MCLKKIGAFLVIILLTCFLAACGELNSVLAVNTSYKVNARVSDGYALDDCGIVSAGSRIRPYFISPVEDDPDVVGLKVFLQTPEGTVIGREIQYVLQNGVSAITDDSSPEGLSDQSADSGNGGVLKIEITGQEPGAGKTLLEGKRTEIPANGETASGQELSQKAGVPEPEQSTREEDKTVELPQTSGDKVVYVSHLERDLPFILLPENLEVGQYILVFQIIGVHDVLHQIEKPIYYVSDAVFSLGDIQTYRSVVQGDSSIVPPGQMIMLKAHVNADSRFDPYLIWYNGKNRIAEGFVSQGADQVLWKAPEQNGFQALIVELFPAKPLGNSWDLPGMKKELSLPISLKNDKKGAQTAEGDNGIQVRRYSLGGNLLDSQAPLDSSRGLNPEETTVEWAPYGSQYGLVIGPGRTFLIPGALFTPLEDPGRGQVILRFAPLSEGALFNASFTMKRPGSLPLTMDLVYEKTKLVLTYGLGIETRREELFLPTVFRDEYITAVINFTIEKTVFLAKLGTDPKNSPIYGAGEGIRLPDTLSGEGTFRIGSTVTAVKPQEDSGKEVSSSVIQQENAETNGVVQEKAVAILDDITVLFQAVNRSDLSGSIFKQLPSNQTGERNYDGASQTETGLLLPNSVDGAEVNGSESGKTENAPAVKAVHSERKPISSRGKSRSDEIENNDNAEDLAYNNRETIALLTVES